MPTSSAGYRRWDVASEQNAEATIPRLADDPRVADQLETTDHVRAILEDRQKQVQRCREALAAVRPPQEADSDEATVAALLDGDPVQAVTKQAELVRQLDTAEQRTALTNARPTNYHAQRRRHADAEPVEIVKQGAEGIWTWRRSPHGNLILSGANLHEADLRWAESVQARHAEIVHQIRSDKETWQYLIERIQNSSAKSYYKDSETNHESLDQKLGP
jgi:hypothetical protein